MEYCRNLEFTAEPNYKHLIGLFYEIMKQNDIDSKVPDFIWQKNRLEVEKSQLK